jgi:hypothetical protein
VAGISNVPPQLLHSKRNERKSVCPKRGKAIDPIDSNTPAEAAEC